MKVQNLSRWMILLFAFSVASAWAMGSKQSTSAPTLAQTFSLPPYLAEHYGDSAIILEWSDNVSAASVRPLKDGDVFRAENDKRRSHTGPYGDYRMGDWLFSLPSSLKSLDEESLRARLASLWIEYLLKNTFKKQLSNSALLNPDSNEDLQNQPILERIVAAGATAIGNCGSHCPLKGDSDIDASLWWRLKFPNQAELDQAKHPEVLAKKGRRAIWTLWQHGYQDSDQRTLKERLDPGHAMMGFRTLGGEDPDQDWSINPGAKNLLGGEASLPFKIDPEVPNMVRILNLWDWVETNVNLRYVIVDVRVFGLTDTQIEAIERFVKIGDKLQWGFSMAFGNNCADGTARILNTILPIDNQIEDPILPARLPIEINSRAEQHLPMIGHYEYARVPNPDPSGKTPGTDYMKQNFGDRRNLNTFQTYQAWEAQRISP